MVKLQAIESYFGPATKLVNFKSSNKGSDAVTPVLLLNTVLPPAYVLAQLGERIPDGDINWLIERGFIHPKTRALPRPIFSSASYNTNSTSLKPPPKDLVCFSYYSLDSFTGQLKTWMQKHCSLVLYRKYTGQASKNSIASLTADPDSPAEDIMPVQFQVESTDLFDPNHHGNGKVSVFSLTPDNNTDLGSSLAFNAAVPSSDKAKLPEKTLLRAGFQSFALPKPEIILLFIWLIWVVLLFLLLVLPVFPFFEDYTVASPDFINSLSFHEDKLQQQHRFSSKSPFHIAAKLKQYFMLGVPKRKSLIIQLGLLAALGTITLIVLLMAACHSVFFNILPILFILSTLVAISSPWLLSTFILAIYLLFVLCSTLIGG